MCVFIESVHDFKAILIHTIENYKIKEDNDLEIECTINLFNDLLFPVVQK